MNEHNFEGRVAIVTGAGRGIGRAHAILLAARGASVVVNDLGGSIKGNGADAEPSSTVAAEIVAAGGAAIADNNDVATVDGAQSLVDAAVARFGRLDILINNAGIIRWAGFPEADADNLAAHLAVHVFGSFNTARGLAAHGRAALRPYRDDHFGGTLRTPAQPLVRDREGRRHRAHAQPQHRGRRARHQGQRHRARAPSRAWPGRRESTPEMSPDLVAPMVAFLAHEDCPVSGEIYAAGFGRFARVFIASTPGYVHDGPEPTIEDVADNWATINDETGYTIPADLTAWSAQFTSHQQP